MKNVNFVDKFAFLCKSDKKQKKKWRKFVEKNTLFLLEFVI